MSKRENCPDRCPACKRRTFRIEKVIKERPYEGTMRSGMIYNKVRWMDVQCSNCNRIYRINQKVKTDE